LKKESEDEGVADVMIGEPELTESSPGLSWKKYPIPNQDP
jgi:hypothetical protein